MHGITIGKTYRLLRLSGKAKNGSRNSLKSQIHFSRLSKNVDFTDEMIILQSRTKYFGQTIAHYEKSSISIFKKFFAGIDKTFILGGRQGTRQQFCEVLSFS